jgi:hypothetical protein
MDFPLKRQARFQVRGIGWHFQQPDFSQDILWNFIRFQLQIRLEVCGFSFWGKILPGWKTWRESPAAFTSFKLSLTTGVIHDTQIELQYVKERYHTVQIAYNLTNSETVGDISTAINGNFFRNNQLEQWVKNWKHTRTWLKILEWVLQNEIICNLSIISHYVTSTSMIVAANVLLKILRNSFSSQ